MLYPGQPCLEYFEVPARLLHNIIASMQTFEIKIIGIGGLTFISRHLEITPSYMLVASKIRSILIDVLIGCVNCRLRKMHTK